MEVAESLFRFVLIDGTGTVEMTEDQEEYERKSDTLHTREDREEYE